MGDRPTSRLGFRIVALAYLGMLVILPLAVVTWHTFAHGIGPVWTSLSTSTMRHAFQLTVVVTAISVLVDAVLGVGLAVLVVRHHFPGRRLLDTLIDVPLSVSPVVVGLALVLVYGRGGWLGGLGDTGLHVIYATPGIVLATVFVSLPLVVLGEVAPVLEAVGTEQEQAAWTLGADRWQTFRRITLPSIQWAVVYGVVLSLARSLGEFGAVKVVSGNLVGQTQTATLVIEQSYLDFDQQSAYAAAFVLAAAAVLCLVVVTAIRSGKEG